MKAAIVLLSDYKIQNFVRKIAFDLNRIHHTDFLVSLVPAHISLKQPFFFDNNMGKLEKFFDSLAKNIEPFKIELDNIYYNEWNGYSIVGLGVKETTILRDIHNRINKALSGLFENTSAPHDGDGYQFHLTIEMRKIEGENVYRDYFDNLKNKKIDLSYNAKDIALFYYADESLKIGSFMTYKVLPLGKKYHNA